MGENPELKKNNRESSLSGLQISWLWVSVIAFLICTAAACGLIFFGKRLEVQGIVGNIYYIILIPLGFSCAAFLAGAMKSYATYTSNESFTYGKLYLAGPIVIFVLVVGGGFVMPKLNDKEEQFVPKFRIVNDKFKTTSFTSGNVTLNLPDQPSITNPISRGEVSFTNIPIRYLHRSAKLIVDIENYETVDTGGIELSKNVYDIRVEKTDRSSNTIVRGTIINQNGGPVKNAILNFGSGLAKDTTDDNGDFLVKVPLPEGGKTMLSILMDGIQIYSNEVTVAESFPMNLKLKVKL